MNLLRLPFVVLIDIFKSIDFREKFLISLLSKRARKTLKLTCVIPHLTFNQKRFLQIHAGTLTSDSIPAVTSKWDYLIEGMIMTLGFYSDGIVLLEREQSIEKQLLLANYVLNIFRKPTISLKFHYRTRSALALSFIKMTNERQLSITSVTSRVLGRSAYFIPEFLDECCDVTDFISIFLFSGHDSVYTPSRPFKVAKFHVHGESNRLDLEKFMSCRTIAVRISKYRSWTVQYLNSFFTNWMDSDVQLENLTFCFKEESANQAIMNALNNQGAHRTLDNHWIEVNRENGPEFFFRKTSKSIRIYTKQAYAELLNVE
uniref:F-box domain-containing protein n=1 Tax=Caenorhabditis tropicalis TaxID=1561998 RepID=A0A1I7UET8_9PELO